MSRYDVILFVTKFYGDHCEPLPGVPAKFRGMYAPPAEFIAAVNAALATGATLVGGVCTGLAAHNPGESYLVDFVFSQAVLYPPPVKVLVAASALEAGPPAEDGAAGGAAGSGAAV